MESIEKAFSPTKQREVSPSKDRLMKKRRDILAKNKVREMQRRADLFRRKIETKESGGDNDVESDEESAGGENKDSSGLDNDLAQLSLQATAAAAASSSSPPSSSVTIGRSERTSSNSLDSSKTGSKTNQRLQAGPAINNPTNRDTSGRGRKPTLVQVKSSRYSLI
jgi:hypothetical protein